MPVRKLHLCVAVIVSVGAGDAAAHDTKSENATLPYTVWKAALTADKAEWASPLGGVIGMVIDPSTVPSETKALDLKKLSLSDFGDVDPSR